MKKRIALLAALMLLSLAACGKKESAESKTAQGYKDGTYSGEAEVKEVGGTIKLDITVSDGKIMTVDMQNLDRDGKEKGEDYGKSEPLNQGLYSIAQNSILGTDKLPALLVESQDPDRIDAVSGATLSREAFVQAAKAALDGAK